MSTKDGESIPETRSCFEVAHAEPFVRRQAENADLSLVAIVLHLKRRLPA
jgi:hypothetical protein